MQIEQVFDPNSFFNQCRKLVKQKEYKLVIEQIAKATREGKLDPAGLARAGRLLSKIESTSNLSIAFLGQCTTTYLIPHLRTWAATENNYLDVDDEIYDNVMQAALQIDDQVDIVILLPWHQRILASTHIEKSLVIEQELEFWQQIWQVIQANSNARILQIGYDWCDAGAEGQFIAGRYGGDIYRIRHLNQLLCKELPESAYFIDLGVVSGLIGRASFYDARSYYWIKQPFSELGLSILAKYVWAGMRALSTGRKKVLVLDLDNTLWGGVVGELGANGVDLDSSPDGEAFLDFQRQIKAYSEAGVVLAVCSKNNESDAKEVFRKNPHMLLQLKDFAAFKANWRTKSENIMEISKELNLGLDSFVFFDDSIFEREQVKNALPEVTVVNVSSEPSSYRQTLLKGLWFESLAITQEDASRTRHYQEEQHRKNVRVQYQSLEEYLRSLQMQADIGDVDDHNLDRVVQLIGKTNQFNLTTRRYSREQIVQMLREPESFGFTLKLKDKFGDYGLVSVVLVNTNKHFPKSLFIDTWLMSCRVIGRGVENFVFNCLLERAKQTKVKRIIAEYIPTTKNTLVKDLYHKFGFVPLMPTTINDEMHSDGQRFVLDVDSAQFQDNHVQKMEQS